MSAEPVAPALEPASTEEVPQFETPSVAPPVEWRLPVKKTQLLALAGLGLIALLPLLVEASGGSIFWFYAGAYGLVYAMIGLSVVVVTGYSGMISLMPYSFAGIGAIVTGLAMTSWGWPFWLCVPLAALATVPVSIIVGAISVRLKGLYLAIATLTIAAMLGETFFNYSPAIGGNAGWSLTR